ncbi:MAG TPA: hypothetical protein VJL58_06970 [Pyrinomonadaceae bacterium]|nr:hypothetical protein [Pyrinomonadaceae bacterium]
MKTQAKLYIVAALLAVLVLGIVTGHLWAKHRIRQLEQLVEITTSEAAAKQHAAAQAEKDAEIYKEKIGYLETSLAELEAKANKKDDELETLTINTDNARRAVERARRGSNSTRP